MSETGTTSSSYYETFRSYLKDVDTSASAAASAAFCLIYGLGTRTDTQQAISILLKHHENIRAQSLLAHCYLLGERKEERDIERGKRALETACKAGDLHAHLVLGDCHRLGHVVTESPNASEALRYYNLVVSATQDSYPNSDLPYLRGLAKLRLAEFTTDPEERLSLSREAAELDFPVAWYQYGMLILQTKCDGPEVHADNVARDSSATTESVQRFRDLAIQNIKRAAEARYVEACLVMGRNYGMFRLKSFFVDIIDFATAIKYYLYASEQGDTEFQDFICRKGQSFPKDLEVAPSLIETIRVAAEKGDMNHQVNLGICYEYGLGVERDDQKAFDLYNQTPGHPFAEYKLADYYFFGKCGTQDYTTALSWAKEAASRGFARAYLLIAVCYDELIRRGVEQDTKLPYQWLVRGAELGDVACQIQLHFRYQLGFGIEQNDEKAAYWLQMAAEEGDSGAQYALAQTYDDRWDEAFMWYRKAAAQGRATAQCQLANMYFQGLGVKKDYAEYMKWLQRAADQGDMEGYYKLYLAYDTALGVDKDPEKAFFYLSKAAEAGHPIASIQLKHPSYAQYRDTTNTGDGLV